MKTIGFIGLGHMGNPMAQHLIRAGYTVYVYDVVPEAVAAVVNAGATAAASIAQLTQAAEVILLSLQTSQQVESTCLAEDGIFAHAAMGQLIVDCSSIDIDVTRKLHDAAERRQLALLDAPVSGGVAGANAATLTFMVGGSATHFQRAQPILAVMGQKIIHAGAAGSGQAAKICNNLLLGISMIGVCEAFSLAKKLGLDQKKFFDISSNASGQCWAMTSYCPIPGVVASAPSNQNYKPGFMAKMMLKDLRLAHHAAESVAAVIPLGAVATELYELFVNQGHGEMDFSGIINFLNR